MENARLINETREALEQQTATAEVLEVINSSPGDLAPVFDAILEKAMRLCEAAFGVLWTYDGEVCSRGAAGRAGGATRSSWPTPHWCPARACARDAAARRAVVHNVDLADEDAYRTATHNAAHLVDLGGARTALHVPLRKDDALLGVITIYRQEVRPFTDKQIALLAELRGAGGHRDGERAAHHRDARGVGAADRHRRGIAGDQLLARRLCSRCSTRCSNAPCDCANRPSAS